MLSEKERKARQRASRLRYYQRNKKTILRKNKEWFRKNKRKRTTYNKRVWREQKLRSKFGLTIPQFEAMILKQKGRCAICGNKFKNSKDTCLDHSHTTGKARGILCCLCNYGLGSFKDNSESLLSAVRYLRKYEEG